MVIGVSREDICRFPYTKHPVLGDIDYITHMHDLSMVKKKNEIEEKEENMLIYIMTMTEIMADIKGERREKKLASFLLSPLSKRIQKPLLVKISFRKNIVQCFFFLAEILKI